MHRLAVAATLTLLFGCQAPQEGGRCLLARAAELPFRVAEAHLLVDMTINDAPATLVFDTGAFTTTLTQEAADRLRLTTEAPMAGFTEGIGGSRALSLVVARSVALGHLHGRNFHFVSADFGPPLKQFSDGLLSTDFLSKYDIDLDYHGGRVILYYPRQNCSHASAFLEQPLYGVTLLPFGEHDRTPKLAVEIGGKRFVAAIDTGASRTVMFRSAASRLGLRIDDLTQDLHATAGGVGPDRVRAVRHVFEPITVGELTIQNMPVGILDQRGLAGLDMLLGLDFLSRVHVWISYSSGTLVMQYPPRPSPNLPGTTQPAPPAK